MRSRITAVSCIVAFLAACSQTTSHRGDAESPRTQRRIEVSKATSRSTRGGFTCQMGDVTLQVDNHDHQLLTVSHESEKLEVLTVNRVTYARLTNPPAPSSSVSRRKVAQDMGGRWGTVGLPDTLLIDATPHTPEGCLEWMGLKPVGLVLYDGVSKVRDAQRSNLTFVVRTENGVLSQINVENGSGATTAVITLDSAPHRHTAPAEYVLMTDEEYRLIVGESHVG